MNRLFTLLGLLFLFSDAHQQLADDASEIKTGLPGENEEHDRIIGGTTTSITSYPFMAVILDNYSLEPLCSGTLYRNKYIITAAHCGETSPSNLRVLLNSTYSYVTVGSYLVPVTNIIKHPKYVPGGLYEYDVAIMTLANSIPLPSVILPPTGSTVTYANKTATIVGWGVTEIDFDNNLPASKELRKATVIVTEQDYCAKLWAARPVGYTIKILDNKICAFARDVSICHVDSGGPLLVNSVQVGIASSSYIHCIPNAVPNLFTRVTKVNDWIRANTP